MQISVCMATFNGEKYIEQQLRSILVQLTCSDEIIISDDGSTDRTIQIIRSFNDSRIKLIFHRTDHGFAQNFENALQYASGDVIFLSDQDDVWRNDKVRTSLLALEEADFVVSDCRTINAKEELISGSRFEEYNIKTGFWRLMIRTRYLGCCMAFKRRVLEACLPFPKNYGAMEHDLWIASVSECYFKTRLIHEPLITYRRHNGNASSGGMSKGFSLKQKIYRRIYRLWCLVQIRNKVHSNKAI